MNNWAIERDETGRAVRMVYMGRIAPKRPEPPPPGCPGCGFHFGWHKRGCSHRASGEKP